MSADDGIGPAGAALLPLASFAHDFGHLYLASAWDQPMNAVGAALAGAGRGPCTGPDDRHREA